HGRAGVADGKAAREAFGRTHGDGAHDAVAELLLHLERDFLLGHLEGVVYLGHGIPWKFHVDNRADNLYDATAAHVRFLLNPKINISNSLLRQVPRALCRSLLASDRRVSCRTLLASDRRVPCRSLLASDGRLQASSYIKR